MNHPAFWQPPNRRMAGPRVSRSFTLVELLVVIAIIAMLAALLSPALARARELGRSAVCLSNLRQQGQLFALYTQDNNGDMPPPDASYPPSSTWYRLLYPYAGVKTALAGQSVFACPSDKAAESSGHSYALEYFAGIESDYVTPAKLQNLQDNLFAGSPSPGQTKRWLVMDSRWYEIYIGAGPAFSSYPATAPVFRHNGRLGVLFPDFHVESMDKQQINSTLFAFNWIPIP